MNTVPNDIFHSKKNPVIQKYSLNIFIDSSPCATHSSRCCGEKHEQDSAFQESADQEPAGIFFDQKYCT